MVIRRAASQIKGLFRSNKKRKNRAWVVLVDKGGIRLLSTDFFKQYHPEEDRYSVSVRATERRLKETIFGQDKKRNLTYLDKFAIKGGSSYKDLHVFYDVFLSAERISEDMKPYLRELRNDSPQEREVRDALTKQLEHDPRHLLLTLDL